MEKLTQDSIKKTKCSVRAMMNEVHWKEFCFILHILKNRQKDWMVNTIKLRSTMIKMMKRKLLFGYYRLDR